MRMKIPNRKATQLRINETLLEKTRAIGVIENRNLNSQIEYFIKKGVEAFERENGTVPISSSDA